MRKPLNLISIRASFRSICAAWAAITACSQPEPAPIDTPVARVGEIQITSEQLRRFALDVLPGLRPAKQGQAARQDYLQTMIDRELILSQARDMELGKKPAVHISRELERHQYLANIYRQRNLLPRSQITDADIKRYFDQQNLARERLVTAIMVKTEAEAEQLRQQFVDGASFADLAVQHTLDPMVAEREGKLGFMNRSLARRTGIPAEVFDNLPTGEISPPLPIGPRFHLVRFIEDRQVGVESQRELLATNLAKVKRREVEQQEVELLAYESNWQLLPQGLDALKKTTPTEIDLKQPLFTYDGGEITCEEYREVLKRRRMPRSTLDSTAVAAFARRTILPELMLAIAAEKAGYHLEEQTVKQLTQADEELLLQAIYQLQVSSQVSVSETDVGDYIDTHPERFMIPESICFDELIAPTAEEAQDLKAMLNGQEDWTALAETRGFEHRPRNADGLVCMHSYNSTPYPKLWSALQKADIGIVSGPIRTRAGFTLFKVANKEAARPEPPPQAQKRAHSILTQQAEQIRFDQWLAILREQYQAEVEIYDEELATALPEALLASLVRQTQDN